MNVKDKISMAEFGAIVNVAVSKCYENGSYDPTYLDFWTQYAVLCVFCDYPFTDKDLEEVWDSRHNDGDIRLAWNEIKRKHMGFLTKIEEAITRSIEYKNRVGAYSMTDMALTNLIDAVSEKVDSMGDLFTEDNVQAFVDMSGKLSKLNNVSQKKIITTIIETMKKKEDDA